MGDAKFHGSLSEIERAVNRAGRTLDTEEVIQDVEWAVRRYKADNRFKLKPPSPAERRNLYKKLLKQIRAARTSFEIISSGDQLIDPMVWLLAEHEGKFAKHTERAENDVILTVEFLKKQELWLEQALVLAAEVVNTNGGRPLGSKIPGLHVLINALVDTWERQTGETPKRTSPQGKGISATGPFISFVDKVVAEAELKVRSVDLSGYVVDIVKKRRKQWGKRPRFKNPVFLFGSLDGGDYPRKIN